MTKNEIAHYFECLGEIWRDITAMEFLMRSGIAKKDGEENKFPQPPYEKGKSYDEYPCAFQSSYGFEVIVEKWNKRYPAVLIPKEIVELRHAMAHGVMAHINNNEVGQLLKFKEQEGSNGKPNLFVEFSMPLEKSRLDQIRQSLKELRRFMTNELG